MHRLDFCSAMPCLPCFSRAREVSRAFVAHPAPRSDVVGTLLDQPLSPLPRASPRPPISSVEAVENLFSLPPTSSLKPPTVGAPLASQFLQHPLASTTHAHHVLPQVREVSGSPFCRSSACPPVHGPADTAARTIELWEQLHPPRTACVPALHEHLRHH